MIKEDTRSLDYGSYRSIKNYQLGACVVVARGIQSRSQNGIGSLFGTLHYLQVVRTSSFGVSQNKGPRSPGDMQVLQQYRSRHSWNTQEL